MKKIFLTAIAFAALGIMAQAQDLITVAELSSKLKDANLVVVSAEVETEYAKVHINDAVNVSYKSLEKTGSIEGLLQSPAELAKIFGAKGLNEKKTIVVYDEGAGKYASRLYWALKYMGATDVKILDGGMVAWKAGRKPVTKNPSTVKPATFTPAVNNAIYADMKEVQAASGNAKVVLVDLREVAEFTGKDPKNNKGRIPGSVNVDHTTLNAANSLYKSKAELEKIFTAAGATKDKTIILVCPTGVRAGKGFVALKSILGYPNVKVYEGGVNEWAATASNKLDK
jgi:thiosulfate/3-mercaptopyruvate sulfurtransferase